MTVWAAPASAGTDPPEAWSRSPVPTWVDPLADRFAAEPDAPADAGATYLVLDRQVRVEPDGDGLYTHVAVLLGNVEAVQRNSQLTLVVDPSYQRLQVHHVRLWRDGRSVDALAAARITTLPQEADIAAQVYNGNMTVNLLLPDVRAGDVLDYAFTTQSANPLFAGHFAGRFDTGWSDAVAFQRLRISHPTSRPLQVRTSDDQAAAVVTRRAGVETLEWTWRNLTPHVPEDDVPPHVYAWPHIEVSDMASWSEAGEWANAVFMPYTIGGPAVAAVVAEIRAGATGIEEQVLAAYRQVQEGIRYAAIAIGPGSHQPSLPEVVLRRRFGDCKDKSVLLVALLRGLGVEAWPALVHTSRGVGLPNSLVTPYAFNHAIVLATLPDGREFWLDGTDTYQRGDINRLVPPDFAHALVIRPGTARLEQLPAVLPSRDVRESDVRIDARAGTDKPALVDVLTTYSGKAADFRRARAAQETPADLRRGVERYLGEYFQGIEALSGMELRDDPIANVVTVSGRFRLPVPFRPVGKQSTLAIKPDLLDAVVYVPESRARTLPLAAVQPSTVRQRFRVQLPEEWPVTAEIMEVENDAFSYRSDVAYSKRTLDLKYEFVAKRGFVPAEDAQTYAADMERVANDAAYYLYDGVDVDWSDGVAAAPLALTIGAFMLSWWLCLRYFHPYDPPPRSAPADAPQGIRGFLVLPALSVVAAPALMLWVVWEFLPLTNASSWSNLPAAVTGDQAVWAKPVVSAVFATTAALLPYYVTLAIAFFNRRTSAPLHWIAATWVGTGYDAGVLVSLWWVGLYEPEPREITSAGFGLVSAGIWTTYMLTSTRVAATFVRRRKEASADISISPAPHRMT